MPHSQLYSKIYSTGLSFYGVSAIYFFIPQLAEVASGVPGRLRPRIFLTFGITRVVGRQPYAFTPGEIPGTHFQRLSRPQGTRFCRGKPRKKFPVTPPGIFPGTVRLLRSALTTTLSQAHTRVAISVILANDHMSINFTVSPCIFQFNNV